VNDKAQGGPVALDEGLFSFEMTNADSRLSVTRGWHCKARLRPHNVVRIHDC
jgi:hypothetical protein